MGSGSVTGAPRALLRLEGVAALVTSVVLYRHLGGSWGLFALCFLIPDISMAGYLAGPRVGSAVYNAAHTHAGPVLLWLADLAAGTTWGTLAALIWAAHIGGDRALGYGLKYPGGFGLTHLGLIGRGRAGQGSPS